MNGKTERIRTLEGLVEKYQASYYAGEADISDGEFDLLWDELSRLDPENALLKKVGAEGRAASPAADVDGFPKKRHRIPMGSQSKAANPDEFREWAAKTGAASWTVQYKLDGASLELQYERGILAAAVTRGDGIVGDDITPNALRMEGVLPRLGEAFSGGVRGEVLMTRAVWQAKHSEKANCRNAANGIMRRKDGEGCEDLRVIAYDVSAPGNDSLFARERDKIAWLQKQGFQTPRTVELKDAEEVIAYRERVAQERERMDIDIDGLVVKDSIVDMADLRRPRPERQIAFKFALETAFSILRGVEWSESGATYTPIGIIDPVRIAGTTVQRANLNNPGRIRAMGLRIGQAVSVVKRGEIIPKIEGRAPEGALPGEDSIEGTEDIVFPETCASCGAPLEDEGTRLYCPNTACPKRLLHRLQKWVKVLDIMEIGDKLIQQLFDSGRVRHIADLYTLTAEELAAFERMGDVSGAKVVRYIRAPRALPLAAFIAGLDFEGVGELVMEKIAGAGYDTLEKLRAASLEALAAVYGIGEITAGTIVQGLAECKEAIDAILAAGVIRIAPPPAKDELPLRGLSFCFTGELATMKRSEAQERVKALGGAIKSSVVKDLSYLVTNDPGSGSAKNQKAQSLGVALLDEAAFLRLLERRGPEQMPRKPGELF
ncbi:MAG: NAD-dependent DNA ligase LigA [Treponema sp.]|jgi:DNA ligase (NAD+)|nr:NAD-dependent DNA ligase LigA [Treponema sp.]